MENNFKRKVLMLYAIFVLSLFGCKAAKIKDTKNNYPNTEFIDSSRLRIINSLEKLEGSDCEKNYINAKDLCTFNLRIMTYLKCVKSKEKNLKLYGEVILQITKEVKFYSPCYVRYIRDFEKIIDTVTFSAAIELLKLDWAPEDDPNATLSYAPVNEYVHNFLIGSKIKTIDDLPYFKYITIDAANRHFDVISTEEYYNQIKNLWESGRITLKSQK